MTSKKICTKCKVEKDLSYFVKDKQKKDGYRSSCKKCREVYRQKNINTINKYNKEYREENPSSPEIVKYKQNYDKKYRNRNKEK